MEQRLLIFILKQHIYFYRQEKDFYGEYMSYSPVLRAFNYKNFRRLWNARHSRKTRH